jgi:MatE
VLGWLAIFVIVVLEIGVAASIYFFGIHFIEFFTTDEAVRGLAEESLTFLSVFCFFDAIQGVISGILRGAGKQMIGAAANIIAFYVIGLPLAYYFCFKTSFGINGLMLGLSGGVIFQDIVSLVLITCCESFVFPADSSLVNPALSQSQHGLVSDTDDLEDMDTKSGSQFMSNTGDAGIEMLSPA